MGSMDTTTEVRTPHVLILGGGFGGLWAARSLARAPVRIRDCANVATSFPGFVELANGCGF